MVISDSSHDYKILSPKFRTGRRVSKPSEWYLTLGGGTSDGGRHVNLSLVLSETFWEEITESIHVYFCARAALGPHKIEKEFGLTAFRKCFDPQETIRGWDNFVPAELLSDEGFSKLEGKRLVIDLEMEIWEDQCQCPASTCENDSPPSAKRPRLGPEACRTEAALQIAEKLYADYKAGKGLDLEIHSGAVIISAHRTVVEVRSTYFRENCKCDESPEVWPHRVDVPEFNEEVMRATVDWMYTGNWPGVSNFNLLNSSLAAAHQFQMPELKRAIIFDALANLERVYKPDVMLDTVILAHQHLCPARDKDIFKELKRLFTMNKDVLKSNPRFPNIFRDNAEAFLRFI